MNEENIIDNSKLDNKNRAYATGKRKNSIARVWLKKGDGKISVNGNLTIRQNIPEPQIIMHSTEVRIHPIALGVRKWIREWEKNNGKTFNRQGATIVIELEGTIKDPIIIGF